MDARTDEQDKNDTCLWPHYIGWRHKKYKEARRYARISVALAQENHTGVCE